jgi:hypothetical protein
MSRTTPRLLIPYPDDNTAPWDSVFEAMVLAIDSSLYVPREDRNIIIFGGGTVAFNATTGLLSWSADIALLSAVTGYKWIVPTGSITLNDGQLFYITVARAPQTNTTNTPTVGSNTPNQPSGDNQVLIGIRVGSNVHFRDGFVIGDGQSQVLFDGTGGGFTPGGDLSGTSTNQTVVGWQHKALDAATMGAPATGNVPVYDGVAQKWKAQAGSSLFTPGGDLSGNSTTQTVIGWETKPLDATSFGTPTDAQVPIWNNGSAKWFSVSISGDITLTNAGVVTVTKLQNRAVAATAPLDRQLLAWNATNNDWEPTDPAAVVVQGLVVMFSSTASDVAGYDSLLTSTSGVETNLTATVNNGSGTVLIKAFATALGSPNVTYIPAGLWEIEYYRYVSSNAGVTQVNFQVYKRAAGGTETLLFTVTEPHVQDTALTESTLSYNVPSDIALLPTDRIVIKVLTSTTSGSNITVNFTFDGSVHASHVHSSVPGAAVPVGGDISGTTGNAVVGAWQNKSLDTTSFGAPGDAQIPIWNNGSSKWFTESLSGDATITNTGVVTVAKINGTSVPATPSAGMTIVSLNGTTATWASPSTPTNVSPVFPFPNYQSHKIRWLSGDAGGFSSGAPIAGQHYAGFSTLTFSGTFSQGLQTVSGTLLQATKRLHAQNTTVTAYCGVFEGAYVNAGVAQAGVYRGSAAGRGGFFFRFRFAYTQIGVSSTIHAFFGLIDTAGLQLSSTDYVTDTTSAKIGIGFTCTTTAGGAFPAQNWQAIESDHNTPHLTDLGASFALTLNDFIEVNIFCAQNDTKVMLQVNNLTSGATTTVTLNTNLPLTTRLLNLQCAHGTQAITSGTNGFDFSLAYLEDFNG